MLAPRGANIVTDFASRTAKPALGPKQLIHMMDDNVQSLRFLSISFCLVWAIRQHLDNSDVPRTVICLTAQTCPARPPTPYELQVVDSLSRR